MDIYIAERVEVFGGKCCHRNARRLPTLIVLERRAPSTMALSRPRRLRLRGSCLVYLERCFVGFIIGAKMGR